MNKYLKISFGFWDSVAINIAIVIGVGIYRVPSDVATYLHSPALTILAWVTGGLISLAGALCFAELSSSFPITGGNYIYLRESYSPLVGFIFGWTELLVIRTGSIAAMAFIFSEYLLSFLSVTGSLVKHVAVLTVIILSLVNVLGLRYSKTIQNMSNLVKILMIFGLIAAGVISKKWDMGNFHPGMHEAATGGLLSTFWLALIPILWTYGGWHENTFVAEETRESTRIIPYALIAGVLIVTITYVSINILYIYMVGLSEIASTNLIASKIMQIIAGENGRRLFEALIIISCLGCLDAMILTGSRVTYAMSKDNAFFNYMGKVNVRYATPHRAIIINAMWTIVLIIAGNFNQLIFFTGALVWVFFALAGIGLLILRRKYPNLERPYKVWGYPAVPIAFIVVCCALFINTVAHYAFQSMVGLLLAVSGVPLYVIFKRGHSVTIKS